MAFFEYTTALSCNHNDIDAEHKKLIDLVNMLHDAMKTGKGRDVIGKVLTSLIDYTATHFANEEKLMSSIGYPGLYQQKREHTELLKQANDLKAKYGKGETAISMDTMTFLQKWLTDHIMVSDKKIGEFIAKKK